MADIPFPAAATVVGFSLQQHYTGDVVHRSIYTGAQQTLARAPGRWTGTVELAIEDNDADRREIEAWIISLRGTVNTTEIPLAGRDGSRDADTWRLNAAARAVSGLDKRAADGANTDGSVWLVTESGADPSARGEYVRVGTRLYCVLESAAEIPWIQDDHSITQPGIRVLPGVFPAGAGNFPIVRTGVTVRAQVLDEPVELPLDGEFSGPWTIPWIEVP